MTSKPVKTVSATCACGAKFDREVKRGRPQVWCPTCVLLPFYERATGERVRADGNPANTYTANDLAGLVSDVPERIVNENDRLDLVRVDVEAGMALINAEHKVRFNTLVAGGLDRFIAAEKAQAETLAATQNLYAELAPQFYKPGREIEGA